MDSERLTLTVEEAAALCGISRGLAYALVCQGRIPAVRLGRRWLVIKRDLEDMLRARPEITTATGDPHGSH